MKILASLIFLAIFILISIQLSSLYKQKQALLGKLERVNAQAAALKSEQEQLAADFGYFSNVKNLVKEFKSLFNYKEPGEKLIIIVPKKSEPETR